MKRRRGDGAVERPRPCRACAPWTWISAKLAVVALVAIALYAVLRIASYAPLRRASGEYLAISAREQTHFLESLRGVQSVKLGGQEEKRRAKWLNLLVQATNRHVSTAKMAIGFRTINSLLFSAESLITLWWGALLAMDNLLSVGMLLAFISYKDSFSGRMSGFIDKMIDLRMLNLQVERLADIVLTNQEKLDGSLPLALDTASLVETNIEFEDVSFRYGEREPWVLRHLNLKIAAGEHVAHAVAIIACVGCDRNAVTIANTDRTQPAFQPIGFAGRERAIAVDLYVIRIVGVAHDRLMHRLQAPVEAGVASAACCQRQ